MFRYLSYKPLFNPTLGTQGLKYGVHCTIRQFHATNFILAKNKKKGGKGGKESKGSKSSNDDTNESSTPFTINFKETESAFQGLLDNFNKKAHEIKLGKTNPNIFDHLSVKIDNKPTRFNSLAQTSIKGRNLIITVFDNSNVQSLKNAILDSNLNLNPTEDSMNKQILKVPLPPITTETKSENVKLLKTHYEKFKSNNTNSLNSIRHDIKQKFTKAKTKSDAELKEYKKFEDLHKLYLDKLHDALKNNEKTLMK